MTALDPKDLIWRELTARDTLGGPSLPKVTGPELLRKPWPHTAAEYWSADESASSPMLAGWLYYSDEAILFIGDDAIHAFAGRARTNEDRLLHVTYSALGRAEVMQGPNRKERLLRFATGAVFLMPKKYANTIAKAANHRGSRHEP